MGKSCLIIVVQILVMVELTGPSVLPIPLPSLIFYHSPDHSRTYSVSSCFFSAPAPQHTHNRISASQGRDFICFVLCVQVPRKM